MRITLTKEEVEQIVLDYINSYFAPDFNCELMFNRANLDTYGYANFCVVERVKEKDATEPGSL